MEDKEQKIKITYETNADETAKKIDAVNDTLDTTAVETEKVEKAQRKAGGAASDLGKNLQSLDIPINATVSGFKTMLKQMWLIVANPLGAILAAIVLVVAGLVAVFKSFQPLVDKVEQSMAALGAVFNVVKNAFVAVFTGTKSLSEAFSGMGDDMADAAKRTKDLVKAQQDLEDVLKSQEVATAKNRATINKLNVELRNRTKTEEERLKIADEIVKKENEDYQQRKKLVDQEVRLAREAIAIKAQFTKEEIKLLKETGDATKELAESRGGNYDEEFDALNKARLKAIALEDEATTNVEKAYNRRDKLEDDRKAKLEKDAADEKARQEKENARRQAEQQKAFEFATEQQRIVDKVAEEKRARDKQIAEEDEAEMFAQIDRELEALKKKGEEEKAELEKQNEAKIKLAEQLEASKVSILDKALGLFSKLAGKNKKLQKAAMIAEGAVALGRTAVNTAQGNAAALALGIAQAGPVAGPGVAAPAITLNTVSGALSAASIIADTAQALKSLGGGSIGGGGTRGGGGTPTGGASPQVSFQASSENQIANTIATNTNNQPPIQAFVVESSVTTAQQLANNRINSNNI